MVFSRLPSAEPTFLQSDRVLARAAQPFARFLHVEAAAGILLAAATVMALAWANSPWQASYEALWSTAIRVEVGGYVFSEDLGHVIDDVLMALFFFVVGMEMKRELVVGELRDRRAVALPALAAVGGMVVPAGIYLLFNTGGAGGRGWGVPMATDIAFALGVVALLGRRVPVAVKVLLLTLAIVDDIGAIAVIAVFYSDGIAPVLLIAGLGMVILIVMLHRGRVVYPPVLIAAGTLLWLIAYESGVHATIAGVVMGLLMPARPAQTSLIAEQIVDSLEGRPDLRSEDIRATANAIKGSVSWCDRLIDLLHPWTSYIIVPMFALANAGIVLSSAAFANPSGVFLGVLVGLVIGKLVGVLAFSWVAVRLGLARLPAGVRWSHMVGIGILAGIGFTVSLFITGLAFDDTGLQDDAKIGTLTASIIAAIAGATVLAFTSRQEHHASVLGQDPPEADHGTGPQLEPTGSPTRVPTVSRST